MSHVAAATTSTATDDQPPRLQPVHVELADDGGGGAVDDESLSEVVVDGAGVNLEPYGENINIMFLRRKCRAAL